MPARHTTSKRSARPARYGRARAQGRRAVGETGTTTWQENRQATSSYDGPRFNEGRTIARRWRVGSTSQELGKLAAVPDKEFEAALADRTVKFSTDGITKMNTTPTAASPLARRLAFWRKRSPSCQALMPPGRRTASNLAPIASLFLKREHKLPSKLFFITGIDVLGTSRASEELMRLLALTVATASVLTLAFPPTPRVLAQGSDTGAVGRPLQLDGGPSLGSDNRGPSSGGGSERTEPSAGVRTENSQTRIGKTGDTTVRGPSRSRIGWSSRPRHRFVFHRRGHHVVAFRGPRHRFVIQRHGRRFVAFNEPGA